MLKQLFSVGVAALLLTGCQGEVQPTKVTPGVEVDIKNKKPDLNPGTDDDVKIDVKKPTSMNKSSTTTTMTTTPSATPENPTTPTPPAPPTDVPATSTTPADPAATPAPADPGSN